MDGKRNAPTEYIFCPYCGGITAPGICVNCGMSTDIQEYENDAQNSYYGNQDANPDENPYHKQYDMPDIQPAPEPKRKKVKWWLWLSVIALVLFLGITVVVVLSVAMMIFLPIFLGYEENMNQVLVTTPSYSHE